ncbi:MAG: polymer-forming cytoskeletal protein [Erysipelotrichaceae bacterium]|nr:polymer-forming cytoskeletal protein [Erysipelotrichaceae bacterium]MDY5728033.1 polymer-forming cytoskeletal protein [Erysipelotrichaceae bacterium]
MDERLGNNEDLQDILNDIDDITEEKEESVDLFGKIKAETPFVKDTAATLSSSKQTVTDNFKENKDYEYTVIGCSTLVESNIKCGGSIKVEGTVKGRLTVSGSCDVCGCVEGDIEANDVTLQAGAKVTGNILCKSDFSSATGSSVTGNVDGKNAVINSTVNGNVTVISDLKLTSSAVISGDITSANISVASGAVLNGRVNIKRQ